MMKKYSYFSALYLAVTLTFAACSKDELADGTDTLPIDLYPLEIASVAIEAENSVQPWGANAPQTRVSEETDGNSSKWEIDDVFYVKFEGTDQVGTYRITDAGAGTVEALTLVYWQSASKQQTIIAWHAPDADTDGKLDLSDQSKGLIYVTRAEETATYNSLNGAAVPLGFKHQLAKVRVKLEGDKADDVEDIKIYSYTKCTHILGDNLTGSEEGWITMKKADYNGLECWEANVVPGYVIKEFRINGGDGKTLNGEGVDPVGGAVNTITLTVKSSVPDDAQILNGGYDLKVIQRMNSYQRTQAQNASVKDCPYYDAQRIFPENKCYIY